MKKKLVILAALVAVLLVGILATSGQARTNFLNGSSRPTPSRNGPAIPALD